MHQMCAPFNLQLPIIACYGWLLRTALHLFLPSKRRHWHSYIFIDGKTFFLSLSPMFFSLTCSRHDSLVLIVYFCVISDLKLATRIYCAIVFGFFSLSLCVLPAEIGKMTRGLHTSSSNRTRYDINPTDEWKKEKKTRLESTYERYFSYISICICICDGNDDSACLPVFNDSATLHITLIPSIQHTMFRWLCA